MTEKQTTIIEVNGVKLEVDLRTAKRIDTLKVGSRVKCLEKSSSGASVFPGVVIGFEPFPSLPSITVAYINDSYFGRNLKIKAFNSETKDFEVIADIDNNALEIDRDSVLNKFDRDITAKERELETLKDQRQFFLDNFGSFFNDIPVDLEEFR